MPYRITKSCIQCELCAEECPMGAIEQDANGNFEILNDCDECGECVKVCSVGAIVKCSTFCESDEVIKNIILKLEKANSKEKQDYVQDILLELNSLLLCSNYNSKNPDCLNCHSTSRQYLKEYEQF